MNPWDRSILLIEDNPVDVDLTLRAFARRKLRNRIEVARDGEEALEFVRRWEAGRLTSSSEDRDIKRAYELGVNSYIVKPVEFEKFMEVAAQLELYWCVLNRAPHEA